MREAQILKIAYSPLFLCDYKSCVDLAIKHFKDNDINRLFYYSRNQEDHSVFTTMRKALKENMPESSKSMGVISDWHHILSIVNNSLEPAGIMAESDTEAVYLLSRLKANKIGIPQQVSIISCDNSEITDLVTPSITSIDPGFIELGRKVRSWIQGDFGTEDTNSHMPFYSTPILIQKESSI